MIVSSLVNRVTAFVLDWIELTPKYMLTQKLRNFVLAFTKLYFTQNDTNRVKLALIRVSIILDKKNDFTVSNSYFLYRNSNTTPPLFRILVQILLKYFNCTLVNSVPN